MMTREADLALQEAFIARHGAGRPTDWGAFEPQRQILVAAGCHAVKAARAGYYLVDGIKLSAIQMVCRAKTLAEGRAKWQMAKARGL